MMGIQKQLNRGLYAPQEEAVKNSRAQSDTFKLALDSEHFVMIISPDDPKMANPFKNAIDDFNRVYYSNKNFSISSNLFATAQQMILVKSFPDAKEAYNYLQNLENDKNIYTNGIKKEAFTFFIISADNLPAFYKKANVNAYKAFYDEAYKTVIQQPK
jgi:hypothetical protein